VQNVGDRATGEDGQIRYCKLTRLFVTLAIVSIAGLAGVETYGYVPSLRERLLQSVSVLAAVAAVLLLVQLRSYSTKSDSMEVLRFYRNPHYWGVVILSVAAIISVAVPLRHPLAKPAPPPPPVVVVPPMPATPPVVEPAPPRPPTFPTLHVTGVVLHGPRSTAVINGSTVMLGEDIMGTRLVNVHETFIQVELKGYTNDVDVGVAMD
jgi:hypothetical protein